MEKVNQVKTRNEELMTRQHEFFSKNAKTYESESSMAYKDAGIFLEVDGPWGTSFDLEVFEETKSSWCFLFLSPSCLPDSAGGGD
jgi:hypothetical protein